MVDFGPDILDTEVPEVEPLDVDISSEPQHELAMALSSGAVKSSSPVVFDFSLQSRVEVILNAIINDLVYGEHPKSRVEQILLYILGEVNELPKPHSRVEELLIDLALELESIDISPKSRVEQILLVLLNQPYEFPITHSRVEELLVQLQKHVSEVTGPLPLTITTDGMALLDYRIYGNTVDGESVGVETENLIDSKTVQMLPNSRYGIIISAPGTYTITAFNNGSIYIYARTFNANNEPISDNQSVVSSTGSITTRTFSIDNGEYIAVFDPTTSATLASTIDKFNTDKVIAIKDSTAPDQYIPYGYKLPMVSRGENLFDAQGTDNYGYYDHTNGMYVDNTNYKHWRFPVKEGDVVRWTRAGAGSGCLFYKGNYVKRFYAYGTPLTIPSGVDEITNNFTLKSVSNAMVTKNQPLPDQYIPYYREETPIYIGETKLAKDEYVSYSEQKVYKRTSNLFTPSEDKGYYQDNRFVADDDYLCTPYIPLDDPEYWVKMDFDTTNAPIGGKYGVEWFADYNVPVYGECIDIRFHGGWLYDGRYEVDPESVVVYTPKYVRAFIHKDCTKVNLSIGSDREHSEYAPYLAPQDPPVPLPALPTTEGETTFEYAGGEPQPAQMYVKYNES